MLVWNDPDDPDSEFYAKWLGIQVTVEYGHKVLVEIQP